MGRVRLSGALLKAKRYRPIHESLSGGPSDSDLRSVKNYVGIRSYNRSILKESSERKHSQKLHKARQYIVGTGKVEMSVLKEEIWPNPIASNKSHKKESIFFATIKEEEQDETGPQKVGHMLI